MSEHRVYGREDLAAEVAASRAQLTLVTGDSYVGKSTVLELAAKRVSGVMVPEAIELAWGEGAFQSGFLQSLARVVAEANADRTAVERFARRVMEVAAAMSPALGQYVARQIGIELLTFIGGPAGMATRKVAEGAVTIPRDLGSRLAEANSDVVADSLAAFAAETVAFADQPLILTLDSGERLSEGDIRVLVDSIRRLPSEVRLWMGLRTRDEGERRACTDLVDQLEGRSTELEVAPLPESVVEDWLRDARLDGTHMEGAMRWSGGYPMLVGDLIPELKRGVPVQELPLNKQFVERSRAILKRLSSDAEVAARCLSVLPNRPSEATLREILGLDAGGWAQLVGQLNDARIFTQIVDGEPWFHEQRRQFIVSELGKAEGRESREAALTALRQQFERNLQAFLIAQAQADIRLLDQVQLELDGADDTSGEAALLRGRLLRALGDYPQALTLLADPPRDSRDWSDVEAEAAHNRAEILRLSGNYEQALALWDRLRAYGRAHEDLVAEARSAWGYSLTYKLIDAAREALELCDQADDLRREAKGGEGRVRPGRDPYSPVRRGHFSRHRAELCCYIGDYASAGEECERGFDFYREEEGSASWWELTAVEAQLLRLEGDFHSSLQRAEEAQDGFREGGWKRGSVTVLRHLAQVRMALDPGAAADIWQRLLQSDPHLYPHAPIYAQLGLGECARVAGDAENALGCYAEAERLARNLYGREGEALTSRFGFGREHAYALLGRAAILEGSDEGKDARNVLSYAEERRVPWLEVWSLWLLARTNSASDRRSYIERVRQAMAGFNRRQRDPDVEGAALRLLDGTGAEQSPPPFNFP